MMRRKTSIVGLALLIVLVLALVTVSAASVHLKGGKKAKPAFEDAGLFLIAWGELSGLGNGDVLVSLDASALGTAECWNNGGNYAPGQNPVELTVSGEQLIPDEEIKNGNTPFNVQTDPPVTPVPGAPECPNPNWDEYIIDLSFTSATITVEQAGELVLTVECSFPATSDGMVSKGEVTCTSY
jgi:hypothetical protein